MKWAYKEVDAFAICSDDEPMRASRDRKEKKRRGEFSEQREYNIGRRKRIVQYNPEMQEKKVFHIGRRNSQR